MKRNIYFSLKKSIYSHQSKNIQSAFLRELKQILLHHYPFKTMKTFSFIMYKKDRELLQPCLLSDPKKEPHHLPYEI